jgi:hypothetical protein
MQRITLRVTDALYDRLRDEARAADLAAERESGAPIGRPLTPALAAVGILEREFGRRDARARAARERRRAA